MDSRAELLVVAVDDLLARRVQEIVLPVVVQLCDARDELVARTLGLVGELARPREDRLDVGGSGLLRPHLRTEHLLHSTLHCECCLRSAHHSASASTVCGVGVGETSDRGGSHGGGKSASVK